MALRKVLGVVHERAGQLVDALHDRVRQDGPGLLDRLTVWASTQHIDGVKGELAGMKEVGGAKNVQVTYSRSWKRLPRWLSTVRYCLSSSAPVAPVGSLNSATGRAGKFHDAPLVPVERRT